MVDPILAESYALSRAGEPFALVTVVQSRPPTSGKPGSRAIVRADGSLSGWIGGGCSQSVVVKEGLRCLQDGQPRLVRLRNEEPIGPEEGVVEYAMTCPSGGAMDIYVQPFLPQSELLILGASPVARELSHLAARLDFAVTALDAEEAHHGEADSAPITPRTFVIVATMGTGDEEALARAAASDAAYVGFVASRKKMSVLADYLRQEGVSEEKLARVKAPAGLDIQAATPAEIALSILAEVVMLRRSGPESGAPLSGSRRAAETLAAVEAAQAQDPVCGMLVDISTARHVLVYEDHTYYFCCAHCRGAFEKEPARFVGVALNFIGHQE
jgi:xanthine dehydrogenase accessory factor